MKYYAKDYQREGTSFILQNKCCGIFADPGLGKTAMALAAIQALKSIRKIKTVLIVAPLLVCNNVWPQEIQKWEPFNGLTCEILSAKQSRSTPFIHVRDIYLINPEMLKWFFTLSPGIELFDMLVIDESSRFKNPSGKRFKLLKKHLSQFNRRVILTGTPAPNSLLDLFSQIYLLDLGKTFSKYITHYRRRYFDNVGYKYPDWRIKKGAAESIHAKTAPLVLRFDAESYLDLPELIYNYIHLELPANLKPKYKQLETKLFTELNSKEINAVSATATYRICHQFANGAIYDPDSETKKIIPIHNQKIEALQNLVSELQGKPLLIAYLYKHDLQQIQKQFRNLAFISGDVSTQDKNKIIAKWNSGSLSLLVCQIATVSHGLNLQSGGNDLCFFSLTDNLEQYEQLIRRLYRQGTVNAVRVHHLIAKNTVDEVILKRLQSKSANQQSLLAALQQYRQKKGG